MEDVDKLPARAIVGIDTGGTFTDVTLLDLVTGRIWTAKTPSTPHDPSQGFGKGIAEAQYGVVLTEDGASVEAAATAERRACRPPAKLFHRHGYCDVLA